VDITPGALDRASPTFLSGNCVMSSATMGSETVPALRSRSIAPRVPVGLVGQS